MLLLQTSPCYCCRIRRALTAHLGCDSAPILYAVYIEPIILTPLQGIRSPTLAHFGLCCNQLNPADIMNPMSKVQPYRPLYHQLQFSREGSSTKRGESKVKRKKKANRTSNGERKNVAAIVQTSQLESTALVSKRS